MAKPTSYARLRLAFGLALLLALVALLYFWRPARENGETTTAYILGFRESSHTLSALLKKGLGINDVVMLPADSNSTNLRLWRKYCLELLGRECGSLPLTIVARGDEVAFAIVGFPSDNFTRMIMDRASGDAGRFVAFSGPNIFAGPGCPHCLFSHRIEIIFPMPENFCIKLEILGKG